MIFLKLKEEKGGNIDNGSTKILGKHMVSLGIRKPKHRIYWIYYSLKTWIAIFLV